MIRALTLVMAFSAGSALAEGITFTLCGGGPVERFQACGPDSQKCTQPMYELRVYCPKATKPALTFAGCKGPKVTRQGNAYTVTCASLQSTEVVLR